MKKQYFLLLLDLDGTVLGRDQLISLGVFETIREALSRIQITLVSGREPAQVIAFADELGLTAPQIADNGAMILDPITRSELRRISLSHDSSKKIIKRLSDCEMPFIATYPGGTTTDSTEVDNSRTIRISALNLNNIQADELVSSFQYDHTMNVVKTALPYNSKWAVDFTSAGVNKATAVLWLSKTMKIDGSQMIAVGDSYNDLPMLQVAGLRVAMGDAPEELKQIADFVAPSVDDDGLAVAIDKFILPNL